MASADISKSFDLSVTCLTLKFRTPNYAKTSRLTPKDVVQGDQICQKISTLEFFWAFFKNLTKIPTMVKFLNYWLKFSLL